MKKLLLLGVICITILLSGCTFERNGNKEDSYTHFFEIENITNETTTTTIEENETIKRWEEEWKNITKEANLPCCKDIEYDYIFEGCNITKNKIECDIKREVPEEPCCSIHWLCPHCFIEMINVSGN